MIRVPLCSASSANALDASVTAANNKTPHTFVAWIEGKCLLGRGMAHPQLRPKVAFRAKSNAEGFSPSDIAGRGQRFKSDERALVLQSEFPAQVEYWDKSLRWEYCESPDCSASKLHTGRSLCESG